MCGILVMGGRMVPRLLRLASQHLSAVGSPEQRSGKRWSLPRGETVARRGAEFRRTYQRCTGGNPAGAAIQSIGVAPAISDRGNRWSAGRVSVGPAIGDDREATATV